MSGQVLRGRVVAPGRVLEDGVVVVDGERIAWVGTAAGAPDGVPLPDARADAPTYLPGLVDIHCHGGGGAGFPDSPDVATARRAAVEHLRHGTTSLVASLVTADEETLLARTATLAELADAGELAGIHLEGPYLSRHRCGAQSPEHMTDGRPGTVRRVAQAARGWLTTMTIAPDVPGVTGPGGVAATLADVGALPSFGHTDATDVVMERALAEARAALAAPGTRSARPTVTHLFNGMAPWHHRTPGPVPAALAAAARGDAVIELVADGVHLAPGTIKAVFALVGAANIALITDAMAAAGMPDGEYVLGPAAVVVRDGVARLAPAPGEAADSGAIAGGTAHLLDVLRTTVAAGVDLVEAVTAATATPAAVLGRTDIGALAAGLRADVLEVGEDMRPLRVMRAGGWLVP